jgi:hypothetical protein
MATTVKIRRSGTATATPSSLEHGEIAINYADGKVFWKDASNVITSFTFQSYALASHTHAASDITSGTLDSARLDATLAALAGVTTSADQVIYATGSDTFATTALSAFGRSLIDDADAAAARTTLGVQPTASPAFTGAATFENTGNVVPLTVTNTGTANSFVVNDASGDTSPFVIDAAGNVGIGGAPSSPCHIKADNVNDGVLHVEQDGTGSASVRCDYDGTGARSWIFGAAGSAYRGGGYGGEFFLYDETATAERLRISSTGTATFAGQVLVTAGSVSACSVAPTGDPNTGLYFPAANVAAIVTDGTERVRVAANGRVGIGTSAPDEKLHVLGGAIYLSNTDYVQGSTGTLLFAQTGASTGNTYSALGALTDGATLWGNLVLQSGGGAVLIGYTTSNGAYALQVNSQIYATNATIATSDARFKTRVESLTDATSVIESLRPVAFDFIPQTDRNFATERQVGLIAQEAQEALAGTDYAGSVVAQCGDHLGLAYEKLVPVLIKALQESNARIAALEERLSDG